MRRAFTLIELLIVISIIALLIALLLPVLGSAKREARRSQCASNMHHIGIGYAAWAVENDGIIPVGYVDNSYRSNYHMVWAHTTPKTYMMMGVLVGDGQITDGRMFYCPTQTVPSLSYDTAANRFDVAYTSGGKKKPTRSSYGSRPRFDGGDFHWGKHASAKLPDNLPLIDSFHNNPVLATDLTVDANFFNKIHNGGLGMNSARLDGSVSWVWREQFIEHLTPATFKDPVASDAYWTAIDEGG